jgi:hypothetical protein
MLSLKASPHGFGFEAKLLSLLQAEVNALVYFFILLRRACFVPSLGVQTILCVDAPHDGA